MKNNWEIQMMDRWIVHYTGLPTLFVGLKFLHKIGRGVILHIKIKIIQDMEEGGEVKVDFEPRSTSNW